MAGMKKFLFFSVCRFFLFLDCAVQPSNQTLILATTTSTQDSGLLEVLIPLFEAESGYTVQTVAVGSGQAMKMGDEGNADVLLVHAPAAEVIFMQNGFGKDRALVMHNDFVIVGPASDPAGVRGKTVVDALKAISAMNAEFISRGDDSGTHKAELGLWKKAALEPPARANLLEDLSALLAQNHRTTIFVTHNLNEAAKLGDRIGVVIGGVVRQVGTAGQIKSRPADESVRAFLQGLPQ